MRILIAVLLAMAFVLPAQAQTEQERFNLCNANAGGREGGERKDYVKACLKGEDPDTKQQMAQAEKMKDCARQAAEKNLKGDERRGFMSNCLKAEDPKLKAQQDKTKECDKQAAAKNLKGDQRTGFMTACMKG